MTSSDLATPAFLDAAAALTPQVRAATADTEQQRQLPESLIQAFRTTPLFRLYLPRALGGDEVDPLTVMRVIEAVAQGDGSTGRIVQIADQGAWLLCFLSEAVGAALCAADPEILVGGVGIPSGPATEVAAGYRMNGRWAFGSGILHAS